MAFVQADLDALDIAIKSGARVVQFQDRRVEYQTTDELMRVRALILNLINPTGTAPSITRQYRMRTEKGF